MCVSCVDQEVRAYEAQRDVTCDERILWVPAYAWKTGLDAVTLSHPTRYHPLLEKGILELQRAAGVRPIHPLGSEAVQEAEDMDVEDLMNSHWVEPMRKFLWHWRFRVDCTDGVVMSPST